jgi:hypothetical protein
LKPGALRSDNDAVSVGAHAAHETFRLRPNERIREYECIESNEDLLRIERILKGDAASVAP